MPSADRLNVQKAGICAGARRLRLLFVTGFPVSPRPRLVEFTVPRSTGKSPKTVSRQPTPPPRQPALGTPRWRPGLDETIPDGLRREIREETGLDIEPDALTGVYKKSSPTHSPASTRNRARRTHRRLQEHAPRHHRPGLPLQHHWRPPGHQRRGNHLPLGRPERHPPSSPVKPTPSASSTPSAKTPRPRSASTTEPSYSAEGPLHYCITASLHHCTRAHACAHAASPNLAVLDRGGAAGPASAPGLCLGRPARAHAGRHRARCADRSGRQCRVPWAMRGPARSWACWPELRLLSQDPERLLQ
jgi:hypothetical protein